MTTMSTQHTLFPSWHYYTFNTLLLATPLLCGIHGFFQGRNEPYSSEIHTALTYGPPVALGAYLGTVYWLTRHGFVGSDTQHCIEEKIREKPGALFYTPIGGALTGAVSGLALSKASYALGFGIGFGLERLLS